MPERDFLFVGCDAGHDMQSIGGCNAGCHDDCSCSVPVHTCTRCGYCDYGVNAYADEVRHGCEQLWGTPAERFGIPEEQTKEIDCVCDGEGCAECAGTGHLTVETEPVTLEDLEGIDASFE